MPENNALPSIQTVYNLYAGGENKLLCKNVIKIPIAEPVARKVGIGNHTVTPYTALVVKNDNGHNIAQSALKIVIETNEGITVEPIVVHAPLVQYDTAYLLTLPRGTTGIKKAYVISRDSRGRDYRVVQNDLVFDIMETPYNYENYLFALNYTELSIFREHIEGSISEISAGLGELYSCVTSLQARVTALENKEGS